MLIVILQQHILSALFEISIPKKKIDSFLHPFVFCPSRLFRSKMNAVIEKSPKTIIALKTLYTWSVWKVLDDDDYNADASSPSELIINNFNLFSIKFFFSFAFELAIESINSTDIGNERKSVPRPEKQQTQIQMATNRNDHNLFNNSSFEI